MVGGSVSSRRLAERRDQWISKVGWGSCTPSHAPAPALTLPTEGEGQRARGKEALWDSRIRILWAQKVNTYIRVKRMSVWIYPYQLCEPEQVTISPALSFLVCKTGMLLISALGDCWRREWDDTRKRTQSSEPYRGLLWSATNSPRNRDQLDNPLLRSENRRHKPSLPQRVCVYQKNFTLKSFVLFLWEKTLPTITAP